MVLQQDVLSVIRDIGSHKREASITCLQKLALVSYGLTRDDGRIGVPEQHSQRIRLVSFLIWSQWVFAS